jgi:hypothetical protein
MVDLRAKQNEASFAVKYANADGKVTPLGGEISHIHASAPWLERFRAKWVPVRRPRKRVETKS